MGKAGWKFASGPFGGRMEMGGEVEGRIGKEGTSRDVGSGFEESGKRWCVEGEWMRVEGEDRELLLQVDTG